MANGLLKFVKDKWGPIWAHPNTRSAVVIGGTVLGVCIFFYPIVRPLWQVDRMKESEMYSMDNLYPIQLRKQREQREKENQQKI